ncbi:PadR family transcriptional regulator [Edaphobacter flagellatus]|uniref:PadR family transcriptional regulator n=1 Tax=Edaphobacter flagellatus TaxID=1933044 RepID=UPI0021B4529B|nr:PadR family transcriptional regulator [Edaphobacter flagellatus]
MFHTNFKGFRGGCDPHEAKQQFFERMHEARERFGAGFGEFGRGRHGRGRGFGGPWGGRMFGGQDLRYVILQLISEKPSYGYEIIKSIQDKLGGTYAPSPGIVYPMLTMLEEMGWASVAQEGARKLYSITEEGAKALAANRAMVDALFARMDHTRSEYARQRPQQIERAVENLRMALRMKMSSLTAEQINAVTDIIDAAAKQIERV